MLGDFESEFATFPSSSHDNLLDATEIALSLVGHAKLYKNSEEHAYYPPTAKKYWKHKMPRYKGTGVGKKSNQFYPKLGSNGWEKYLK